MPATKKHRLNYRLRTSLLILVCGSWLLMIHYSLRALIEMPPFIDLGEASLNFFVQCITANCSALILPLLGYTLNIGQSLDALATLWEAITVCLAIYFCLQLFNAKLASCQLISFGIFFWLVAGINIFHPYPPGTIPCLLASSIATLKLKRSDKASSYFAIASIFFDLQLGTISLLSLVLINLIFQTSKHAHYSMVMLLKSIFIGILTIITYLLLIGYDFMEWGVNSHHALATKAMWVWVCIALPYLGIPSILLFIYAKKNKDKY